jgi:hypothetical protein
MAWTKTAGTRHTCGGPSFGRLTPGCPRCDELAAGAQARQWAGMARRERCSTPRCGQLTEPGEWTSLCRSCQVRAHDCQAARCGAVCTAFDW